MATVRGGWDGQSGARDDDGADGEMRPPRYLRDALEAAQRGEKAHRYRLGDTAPASSGVRLLVMTQSAFDGGSFVYAVDEDMLEHAEHLDASSSKTARLIGLLVVLALVFWGVCIACAVIISRLALS